MLTLLLACSRVAPVDTAPIDTELPPAGEPLELPWLWVPIAFDDAIDLGHEPVFDGVPVPAGELVLTEVAHQAGLGLAVSGGNLHGVGVGFFDYDGDGWADLLIANGEASTDAWDSSLWRNRGDGTFEDVSEASGLGPILAGFDTYSVAAVDFDADGDVDVSVTAHPHDFLVVNQGDGTFVDGTAAAGAGGPESKPASNGSSKIGAWGDLDGDGWLDLAVASSQFLDQEANGYLLRNLGDGTFEDLTADTSYAISPEGNPCAVLWTDHDNDGDQDLWVFNDRGDQATNRTLLQNDGGSWTDLTEAARLSHPMGNPMGIDAADLDRDGWQEVYVGNIGPSGLFRRDEDGTYYDGAAAAGVEGEYVWGLGFEDLDLDGWWDLFAAQEDNRDYLSWTNHGAGSMTFSEQAWAHPVVPDGLSHNVAVAFADYDHDGDVDIVTAGSGGTRVNLFRNDTDRGSNRWLHVVVPGAGEGGGVSARVVVRTGDDIWYRDLRAGSSRASMNELSVRFGLGAWSGADMVAVVWPDGRQTVLTNVAGDEVLEVPPPP